MYIYFLLTYIGIYIYIYILILLVVGIEWIDNKVKCYLIINLYAFKNN